MNSKNYKQNFLEALKRQYISVIFDIDGTITEIGDHKIPDSLAQKMADLSIHMPLAFGTGRILDHLQDSLDQILKKSKDPGKTRENWYIIAENGGAGYFWDKEERAYKEFYRIAWDNSLIDREELKEKVKEACEGLAKSISINQTQFLIRPYREEVPMKEVQKNTAKITKIAREIIESYPSGNEFEALDSSIAVHVSPKHGNKDEGIKRYAQLLQEKLGLDIGGLARNVLVIGDQAAKGRNDHAFLKGDIGTPFTVEDTTDAQWPLPVFDGEKIITGPKATLHLMNTVNFTLH